MHVAHLKKNQVFPSTPTTPSTLEMSHSKHSKQVFPALKSHRSNRLSLEAQRRSPFAAHRQTQSRPSRPGGEQTRRGHAMLRGVPLKQVSTSFRVARPLACMERSGVEGEENWELEWFLSM